jgi:hypothetical protein
MTEREHIEEQIREVLANGTQAIPLSSSFLENSSNACKHVNTTCAAQAVRSRHDRRFPPRLPTRGWPGPHIATASACSLAAISPFPSQSDRSC